MGDLRVANGGADRLFTGWRGAVLALFCVTMAMFAGAEIFGLAQSYGAFGLGRTGTDGLGGRTLSNGWFAVSRVDRGGSGDRAGIAIGDMLRFDDHLLQASSPPAGTIAQITVRRSGHDERKLITIQPIDPTAAPASQRPRYIALGGKCFCWLLGILVLWRGWGGRVALVLAIGLTNFASGGFIPWWFLHSPITALALAALLLVDVLGICVLLFPAFLYHERVAPLGWIAWSVLLGAAAVIASVVVLDDAALWGYFTVPTVLEFADAIVSCVSLVLACWWAWRGARDADGAERKRFTIVLLAEALLLFTWVIDHTGQYDQVFVYPAARVWLDVMLGQVCFPLMLGYAVLRHRVIDLGFVINRTIVYGSVSVLLLGCFGLIEWGIEHWLPESWVKDSVWIDAGAALLVYLVFHQVHTAVERRVEHVFFHGWQSNEAILRRFVASAPHFEDERALARSFADELSRFSGEALVALYRRKERTHDAILERMAGSWDTAPRTLPVDDPAFALMRAERSAIDLSDALTDLPGVLALPMLDHGMLAGLVLMDLKGNGALYRPDEVAVLGWAAHDVALALAALHAGLIEAENRLLKAQLARLGSLIGDRLDHAEV